ncbi:MAG TPA: tyrosine-type recombinase/integrase [Candidatus Acidoferrum sp.]|nr:tyrosine-type recombinase/integrase [Candidatus Acidoferrum sp.]
MDPKTGRPARTRTWYIEYGFRGQRRRESTGLTNRADAVRVLKRRLGEIGQGRLVGPDAEKTTFEELAAMLIDDYLTNGRKSLERARASVKRLREIFGPMRVMDITADKIGAYIRARQEAGAAAGTIQNELAALKRMFTLGVRSGKVIQRPYIPHLELRNTRAGFFEEAQYRAVLARLPEHLQPLISFLYLTGWRKGEALGLQWRQVDFEAGTVRLEPGTTKNDEGRSFPFKALPALADLLQAQREQTQELTTRTGRIIPWVFHRDGTPIKEFRAKWTNACRAAGVPGRIIHDFRRTAVRNLERAGVPRSVAMKLTGHKTEAVYRRYAIVSEADLSVGVAKLAMLHEKQHEAPNPIIPIVPAIGSAASRAHQA